MEKTIQVKISLDKSMETKEDKRDITDEVFDSMTEAIEMTLKDKLDINDNEFCDEILHNYSQTLPDGFSNLKDMGFKIEIE